MLDCGCEILVAFWRRIDSLVSLLSMPLLVHFYDSRIKVRFRVCAFELIVDDNPYAFFARFPL